MVSRRRSSLLRMVSAVAIAVCAVAGLAGIAAASSRSDVGAVVFTPPPTLSTHIGPLPSATVPDPTLTPSAPTSSPTCLECECPAITPPTLTPLTIAPTIIEPLGQPQSGARNRLVALRLADITITATITIDANGAATLTNFTSDPDSEKDGFKNRFAGWNNRGCYTFGFENVFLKCTDAVITIRPNEALRQSESATRVQHDLGDFWRHKVQFSSDANPGNPMRRKTVTITMTCKQADK